MRRKITVGGREIELECNLGTAAFFQEFAKKNIFDVSSRIATKMSQAYEAIAKQRINDEINKLALYSRAPEAMDDLAAVQADAVDVASKLVYIMNLQTRYGKNKEDIYKIRQELTDEDYLVWSMDFEPGSFSYNTYKEVMSFWKEQTEKTSESKN